MRLNIILFKKSPNSERSGAVAGTTSTNGLNQKGNAHLNHWSLTHSDSLVILSQFFVFFHQTFVGNHINGILE